MSEDARAAAPESRNPFGEPRFARWLAASLVAGTGVGIQAVTVPLLLRDRVELDDRALAISGALIAGTLPGALLSLVGGAVADRVERRRIILRTYSIAATVSLGYLLLAGLDIRVIWPVYPLAAIVGAASAFTNPARQSMLPQMLGRAQLQNGIIFGNMGFMATLQFLGPSIGGLITDWGGLARAFALESVLLAMAAWLFHRVRTETPPAPERHILADLAAGVRYVRGEPALRSLLLLALVPGVLFVGPFAVTVPLLVPDVFHASDKWVGLLWGFFGLGVLLGSILLMWRPLPHRGRSILLANFSGGAVLVAYGWSDQLALSSVLLVVWGMGASIFINYVITLLQENSQPQMIGRIMSMYSLMFFIAMPLGYAQAGVVTRLFGPAATLVSSGVVALGIAVACLAALRPVRELE
ncbi:MAG: MFS transporter [Myxococcota bacterium]